MSSQTPPLSLAFWLSPPSLQTLAPDLGLGTLSMYSKLYFWDHPLGPSPWHYAQNQPAGLSLPKPLSGEAAAKSWSFFHHLTLMNSHIIDSHTISAQFYTAFPAPAGSTGEAAHFAYIFCPSKVSFFTLPVFPQPGSGLALGPG